MLPVGLRNAIVHAVTRHESATRISTRGRQKKLSSAYVLDRIFYVCKTGCQWNQLEVVHPGKLFSIILICGPSYGSLRTLSITCLRLCNRVSSSWIALL